MAESTGESTPKSSQQLASSNVLDVNDIVKVVKSDLKDAKRKDRIK